MVQMMFGCFPLSHLLQLLDRERPMIGTSFSKMTALQLLLVSPLLAPPPYPPGSSSHSPASAALLPHTLRAAPFPKPAASPAAQTLLVDSCWDLPDTSQGRSGGGRHELVSKGHSHSFKANLCKGERWERCQAQQPIPSLCMQPSHPMINDHSCCNVTSHLEKLEVVGTFALDLGFVEYDGGQYGDGDVQAELVGLEAHSRLAEDHGCDGSWARNELVGRESGLKSKTT